MRRTHNPNGVRTVPRADLPRHSARVPMIYNGPPLVPCADCGGLVDKEGEPPYLHDDCRCIRETGKQCVWPDMA